MKKLENELDTLQRGVLDMAELARQMVDSSVQALTESDSTDLISQISAWETRLDQMELQLDRQVIRLLTVYGPVAHDLRFVISASRINSELERVGDNAQNVCDSIRLFTMSGMPVSRLVLQLAENVQQMMQSTVTAIAERDPQRARETIRMDDRVDDLNRQIVEKQLGDADVLSRAVAQVLIARSLERIADQCTNICEEIVFLEQGADIRHQPLAV